MRVNAYFISPFFSPYKLSLDLQKYSKTQYFNSDDSGFGDSVNYNEPTAV